ncbi:protein PSK SIMULATOR 1 [Ricinus communis]|nr:protein PSK SIMULATOR 1 [Ricinus communis]XP_015580530.1 protein PSK SIMULATOR 1 [Ricinus communis]XP_015580532.1 protein PSK SIMULATOR 1 [Ricinus communis]|eukprot:XP_002528655.2 uncharacterized protein LOC8274899 [Ricinus communis]
MGTESWFSNLWWNSRKDALQTEKAAIGVLAFEVASLMSKVAKLWHFLGENEMFRLRGDILNSIGIQKLVSDKDDYLMDLALNEIMENFGLLSRSVARLGRRCIDPHFRRFEHFVNDPLANNLEWIGWEYRLTKMERKVKKMERFVAVTMQLSQELEILAELEQTLRRMRANPVLSRRKLLEMQQKVMWQRQEVRNLREMSPWIRTYDYIVRLLARSLLTILQRIMNVFEISQLPSPEENIDQEHMNSTRFPRSLSFSVLMQSSIYPSENFLCGISPGPPGRLDSKSGVTSANNKVNKTQRQLLHQSSTVLPRFKTNQLAHVGLFKECMTSGSRSPILQAGKPAFCGSAKFTVDYMTVADKMENLNLWPFICSNRIYYKLALFSSKHGLLNAPSSTLGHAALALHYANVIVFIEKLASSPYTVDYETRDDLYNMLPTTIRAALRSRLKAYGKALSTSAYDASLAQEWSLALTYMLEWLSPLAHDMIKWHSERNFERDQEVSRTNVLLLQTLHYANQAKTEAAIVELLVGLNYICTINQDLDEKGWPESSRCRVNSFIHQKGRTETMRHN